MNVLSLFDGISGAQLALLRAGIKVENYFASEIDKYAIAVTMRNFPNTKQIGDVRNVKAADLPKIDLLIGGSPCTSLSSAARQKESGLIKGESTLFWEYVRVLREVKPRWFILENVASMKKTDRDKISEVLGVQPVLVNSALVSAQNRKRYYWTNLPVFGQPRDRGIKLQSILQDGTPEFSLGEKSYALTAGYANGKPGDTIFPRTSIVYTRPRGFNEGGERVTDKFPTFTSSCCEQNNLIVLQQNAQQSKRIYSPKGKSCTINAGGGGGGAKTGLYKIGENVRKLTPIECERLQTFPDNYTAGISNTQRYKCLGNSFTVDVIVWLLSFMEKKKMIYSASKLEVYSQCAKKFKAIYLDGVENKSPQMERGTLIHKEVENGVVSVSKWIPKSRNYAKFSVMQDEYIIRQDGSTRVAKEQFLTVDANWHIVPDDSEKAWMRGKLDGYQIIWDMEKLFDGKPVDFSKVKKIMFFDWKTGKSLGNDLQMGIYLLLLMAKFGLPSNKFEGMVINLDTGKEKVYDNLNPEEIKANVASLVQQIESDKDWRPNVNWFCSYCPVYKSCEAHQQLSQDNSFLNGVLNG